MLPDLECFKNSKKFFVIGIIVKLSKIESMEMKDYQMNLITWGYNRQDSTKSIVRSICFHDKLHIGDPVWEDEGKNECFLQSIESFTAEVIEILENILLDEVGE